MSQSSFLTLEGILSGLNVGRGASVTRGGKSMVADVNPLPFPRGVGLKTIKPGELLSVRVPVVRIQHGMIVGYQRSFNAAKARSIARWLIANQKNYIEVLPVIEISVNGHGEAFFTDGQHRAAGAVIADLSIRAIITRRSNEQARRLFALQGKASRPSRNLMIIDSDGPFEEYLQDAMTSDTHPWSNLVSSAQGGGSKTRMSATAAFTMLQIYVRGRNSPAGRDVGEAIDVSEFDKAAADQLATLMSSFGTRQTNPLAFSSIGLRAIAMAARQVFRVRDPHPDDQTRWIRHMPAFSFATYAHLKSSPELANQMIKYWNLRMPTARKVARID